MSNARNLARVIADSSGAISTGNLGNAPNPISAGTIAYLGMSTAPTGWLKANGAAVSRTTYATLFAAIGTTFGAGNGSTTFNVPDLRGYFVRGWDDSRGVDTGRSFGSNQTATRVGFINDSRTTQNPAAETGGDTIGSSANSFIMAGYNNTNAGTQSMAVGARPINNALLACIKF